MFNNICFYNNRIFKTSSDFSEHMLISYQYNKNAEPLENKFENCYKIKIPSKASFSSLFSLSVVQNFVIGLKCIVILVFDSSCLNDCFLYSETLRNKLTMVSLPNVFRTNVSLNNIFITHGPAFLFTSDSMFHLYSLFGCTYNTLEIKQSSLCKILQFKSFNCCIKIPPFEEYIFIIVMQHTTTQCLKIIVFRADATSLFTKHEQLPVNFFFPQYYQSMMKAIYINKFVPLYKSKSRNLNNIGFQETASVICTSNECFIFSNGTVMYCCKLTVTLQDVICMTVDYINISTKTFNLILSLESGIVFLIDASEKKCEETKVWIDIQEALVGDLLMKGSKQILLLKNIESDLWQSNSVMADVTKILPIDLLVQNSMPNHCLETTITGLSKKIQAGIVSISEMENEVSQKTAAVIDGLLRLNEQNLSDECVDSVKSFRESLMDLILSEDENKNMNDIILESELQVKLLEEKQRFLGDCWIFYFHFMNESSRNICNPSIKALLHGQQLQTAQKIFIQEGDNKCLDLKSCSQVDPKTEFTVLLRCSLPAASIGGMSFILTWVGGSAAEFENEIFVSKEEKVLKLHQLRFSKSTSNCDFLNCKIEKGLSSPDDLLFMKSLQHKTVFNISALHSDVNQLLSSIINSSTKLLQLENSVVFVDELFQLFGVAINFKDVKERMATVEVFTRNEEETLLLVQFLYRNLPDDVLIVPSLQDSRESLKKHAISAMKAEADLLISSLNTYNISDELRKNYSKLMTAQNIGIIAMPRGAYNRLRKAVCKKEFFTDSILRDLINL